MRKSFEDVHAGFCRPAEWAEETMIKYVSQVMKLNIIFLSGNTGRFHCTVAGEPSKQQTVVLAWIDNSHFEPVLFARKRCKDHVHIRGRLSPSLPEDAPTLGHLAQDFMLTCSSSMPIATHASFSQQISNTARTPKLA